MLVTVLTEVKEFLETLDIPTQARVYKTIGLLKVFGYQLGLPQSRALGSGLFELRIRGRREIRILYVFYDQSAVLLHGFIKKTQKTPQHEIHIAQKRQQALTQV